MKTEKHLLIPKIKNGIVIDHVPAGLGRGLLDLIRSHPSMARTVLTLGLNYGSTKLGRKDMIKVHADDLPPTLLEQISLFTPGISIKRVKGYEIEHRYVLEPPRKIRSLARCRNPNCVTNLETHVPTLFHRLSEQSRKFRCDFCERVFEVDELDIIVG